MLLLVTLTGCVKLPADSAAPLLSCEALMTDGRAVAAEADVQLALEGVRDNLYPELAGVPLGLRSMESDSDFFYANLDLTTLDEDPRERDYFVFYNARLFDDPPPWEAVVAILAHEIKHVLDYTGMDTEALAEFGLWYGTTDDISEYERATDEYALALGCGEGLSAYRTWLYDHVDEETAAQKRLDYYTPEEIDAWMAGNGR
jgi:hypothetical protein